MRRLCTMYQLGLCDLSGTNTLLRTVWAGLASAFVMKPCKKQLSPMMTRPYVLQNCPSVLDPLGFATCSCWCFPKRISFANVSSPEYTSTLYRPKQPKRQQHTGRRRKSQAWPAHFCMSRQDAPRHHPQTPNTNLIVLRGACSPAQPSQLCVVLFKVSIARKCGQQCKRNGNSGLT